MILLRLARLISALSHPVVVLPASLPLFMLKANLTLQKFILFLPALLILAIPIFYFLYALKKKKFSDWELTERHERYPLYFLSLFCGGIALWLLSIVGSRDLFTLALIFYLLGVLVTIVNFFWKISAHSAGITTGALVFNLLLGQTPLLYLLIPIVAWSRREEQKHTLAQILGGIILGAVVVLGILRLSGKASFL